MPGPLARPQLRGLLASHTQKHAMICAALCTITSAGYYFLIAEPRKKRYAEFHKNYDAEADFERMKELGVFQSTEVGEGDNGEEKCE